MPKRTSHPGVRLVARTLPDGETVNVARYFDPVKGKDVQESLRGLTTMEAREKWAKAKSALLARQAADVSAGRLLTNRTGIEGAVNEYLDGLKRKRPKTLKLYRQALAHLTTWARRAGVANVEELEPKHLPLLGKHLHGLKARQNVAGKGVGRKTRQEGKALLAPATVNQFIRGIRTFLRHCRMLDLTTLSSDVIRERLKFADKDAAEVHFLRAHGIRSLIEACQRHDAASYTRVGRGEARNAKTFNYPVIAPFVVACLLGGFRFSEAANLKWADFDPITGEITLDKSATKTRKGRTVSLRESPALWAMLETLALQRAGRAHIFGPMRRDVAESCRRRLTKRFGAPAFDWHTLRRTAGTFLSNAPAIFGAASAFLSARRLGHSVVIAEKLYVGAVDLSREATTLEAAMGIADLLPKREPKEAPKLSRVS